MKTFSTDIKSFKELTCYCEESPRCGGCKYFYVDCDDKTYCINSYLNKKMPTIREAYCKSYIHKNSHTFIPIEMCMELVDKEMKQ
jgi:hypothetical protein